MQKNKILLSLIDSKLRSCFLVSYIMVSNGKDEFAIRATTRATRDGIVPDSRDFPVLNLEDYGCDFTHAYESDPIRTDGISMLDMAKFLHGQRMKLAGMLGPVKFAELDYAICSAIRGYRG